MMKQRSTTAEPDGDWSETLNAGKENSREKAEQQRPDKGEIANPKISVCGASSSFEASVTKTGLLEADSREGDSRKQAKTRGEILMGGASYAQSGRTNSSDLPSLPTRLFAPGQLPTDVRVNSYSKPEYLIDIAQVLDGSEEFEWLKDSSFGHMFQLQTRKCSLLGKLAHQFFCRSLLTKKKHELWFVFGGNPVRFSLREFALVTGLNCEPYPCKEEKRLMQQPADGDEDYWYSLIGPKESYTIAGIVNMLKRDHRMQSTERMSGGRRLRLALIVLVEGVLTCNSSNVRPRRHVVEMVKDVGSFAKYPWGRESFELTIEMVQVGAKNNTPKFLAKSLAHSHFTTHGFTLAFQLLFVSAIPQLEKFVHPFCRSSLSLTAIKSASFVRYTWGEIT